MKIALLQTDIVWENKPANLRRAGELIAQLPTDVRFALLPEMFSTGFSMHPETLSETEQGETLNWLRRTAKQHNMALVCSLIVEEAQQYYNRLFFVLPDGAYHTYNKRHLFRAGAEHLHYTAGRERLIVTYEGWRICPLVCYDLRFPVWSRNTGMAYDLLLVVANWPTARINAWDTLLPARAIENQCYVAGVNRCGTDGTGASYIGRSQVVDFKGQVVAKAADHKEDTLIIDLAQAPLHDFRRTFPAWQDADEFTMC
jgi:predicted amidohydrolase